MEGGQSTEGIGARADEVCQRLRRGLEAAGARVEVRETHVSWVLLAGDHAFKLKKPVRFPFVDQSTPGRRRACCEAEVAVNAPLAPRVVLGVRPVVRRAGGLRVGEEGEGPAVDWVVAMRRFDEGRTLASLLNRGKVPPGAASAVARRLVAFHAATPAAHPAGWAEEVRATWARNLDELDRLAPPDARETLEVARGFGRGFLCRRGAELAGRADAGRVRDGHGDLRAEHVVLDEGGVTIVDRLEFDAALRRVDVGDDLAFLLMDLESLGAGDMAAELAGAYRAAGGDPGDDGLLNAFGSYRALVRAKVELLHGRSHASRADALLALAERLMWRARGPIVLAISGPPASGKSTLAAELARRSGLPVVSSDAARKERLGIAAATAAPPSAYGDAARRAVYAELGGRARAALREGGAIVDATFGEPSLRRAFLAAAGTDVAGALRVVECGAAPDVLRRRAAARLPFAAGASDAGPEVAMRLAKRFSPWPADAGLRLVLPADVGAEALAVRCARWIDDEPAAARSRDLRPSGDVEAGK